MTRFARASGSKSSNERVPNEATPWHVMKQQLEESVGKEEVKKTKNAKQLLAEKDEPFYSQSLGNVKNDWAEFDEVKQTKVPKNEKQQKNQVNKAKKRKSENVEAGNAQMSISKKPVGDINKKGSEETSFKAVSMENNVQKKNKKKHAKDANVRKEQKNDSDGKKKSIESQERKGNHESNVDEKSNDTNNKSEAQSSKLDDNNKGKLSKRQKRNQKKKGQNDSQSVAEPEADRKRKFEANDNKFDQGNDFKRGRFQDDNFNKPGMKQKRPRKPPKVRDDKEHKRRKNDLEPVKMTINGIDLEIVKYDGFPVKKEDAERLKELKQQMILKGIPISEVNAAMKLERRKAEKALARVRKQVCFHCRKAGHVLSDCPELGAEEVSAGICFKCGSTEHTHFECRVVKAQEFRHASCFICREQGHIAKQCPDNPKGLYPQGGACKICGDVTHLKKDCPDLVQEKTEAIITAEKLHDSNLECLDEEIGQKQNNLNTKVQKSKVVKF